MVHSVLLSGLRHRVHNLVAATVHDTTAGLREEQVGVGGRGQVVCSLKERKGVTVVHPLTLDSVTYCISFSFSLSYCVSCCQAADG